MLGAPPACGLVLDSPPHVVDRVVGQLDHMERVRCLGGVGHGVAERLAVGPREVHHRPADAFSPQRRAPFDPSGGALGAATGDDVQQDAPAHVDDGGAPVLSAERAAAEHQDLVQAQRPHPLDAARVGGQQRPAPPVHRCHRGVPVAAQLGSDLADRPRPARPPRRPPRRPGGHPGPGRRHSRVLIGERAHRARPVGAQPTALAPLQPHRPPERRKVSQAHLAGAVTMHLAAAAPTARTPRQLDPDPQRPAAAAAHPGHGHVRAQTDNQQQRTRTVNSHRDPPESGRQDTSDSGGSLPTRPAPSTRQSHAQTRSAG